VIVVLATIGVALSACVTAFGMHYLARWQWIGALVFGVLIAATDPVSVIAIFKEAKTQGWCSSSAKACSTTAPPRLRSAFSSLWR
jgi:NhaP-type Na+/H+ or K+/H+ antiporter